MKTVGTITLHGSHNYGSCLQAYALQEHVLSLGKGQLTYYIINLRTAVQKNLYKPLFESRSIKDLIRRGFVFGHRKPLKDKYSLFESFIQQKLNLTKEYSTDEELKKADLSFDYLISGSDQIWNISAADFNWAFFLDFSKKGQKIAYAPSAGANSYSLKPEEKTKMESALNQYSLLSVRDENTANQIADINQQVEILCDPTLLLTKQEWEKLIVHPQKKFFKSGYIFYYDLSHDREKWKIARKMARLLHLPLVISNVPYLRTIDLSVGCKKCFATGPIEFLELIQNASIVLTSSFHGSVFSVLFHKPFFAIKGDKDKRISDFLVKVGLQNRFLGTDDVFEKSKIAFSLSFDQADKAVETERKKSDAFLKKALNLEE